MRSGLYAILLLVVASVISFYHLSDGTLVGDEGTFAYTTEYMRETGDWVVPHMGGVPHLNATPLYNWLSLATFSWFDDTPLRHRVWSAAFGVGCVLLTFAIGARLYGPNVGLLAGLLLAFNRDFMFCHGVRFGGMDAMLAFFVTGAALCHVRLRERPARTWPLWVALGLCMGLAWLSKPPVFGCAFFGLILVQHAWSRWTGGWKAMVTGPLVALAVGVVVAAPWYVAMWDRLGNSALHRLFVYNSVGRATELAGRDVLCCVKDTWHASNAFKLACPAFAAAVVCWLLGDRRSRWAAPLVLAGGFLLALSAAGRSGNYSFYAYPLVAVLVAGLILESGPRLVAAIGWPGLRRLAVGGTAAVALVAADGLKSLRTLRHPVWVHPPVAVYERLAPELAAGQCHYVLVDYPPPDGTFAPPGHNSNIEDRYYTRRMPMAARVGSPEELRRFIATGKPVTAVFPPLSSPQPPLPIDLAPELRVETNPWPFYTFPILSYNGLPGNLTVDELTHLARAGQP